MKIKSCLKPSLLALLLLSSCKEEPLKTIQNGNFKVEYLFEQNGCKMYRFEDGGRYIYWSDCQGKIQSDFTTNSGKHNIRHYEETITTN
ncbi:hypothetical protein BWK59_14010 [Flavobacterium davisii]|uniref:DUF4884 domain-containing protein n=1 Tax=Flavobacterium davisii TaxID=2906077 RepID=A0A246GF84_9FLAO|nr:DUF4884 domain-containing protein [Flavobacterium davisii]OWP82789.1 hypothetical protein BWK59_14010 [Flavobacterium davisii]QYS89133.1 DUF4884 domain-containing protein [Flavobacterium davisii]